MQTRVDPARSVLHLPLEKSVGNLAEILSAQIFEGGSHRCAPLFETTIELRAAPRRDQGHTIHYLCKMLK
jgi:hypothetical protein